MNEDQADMRDKLNQRRAMMNEDLEDLLKTVPPIQSLPPIQQHQLIQLHQHQQVVPHLLDGLYNRVVVVVLHLLISPQDLIHKTVIVIIILRMVSVMY